MVRKWTHRHAQRIPVHEAAPIEALGTGQMLASISSGFSRLNFVWVMFLVTEYFSCVSQTVTLRPTGSVKRATYSDSFPCAD
ncbi:hypothetical protein OKW43_006448 [Paraburkholderia sp. WC7.3g]